MTLNDYQNNAAETAIYPEQGTILGLVYTALGLGEAGEVQNKVKKLLRDDNLEPWNTNDKIPDDKKQAIAKELGGALWYVSQAAKELGYTLNDIAVMNLQELFSRKERNVLNGSGDNR